MSEQEKLVEAVARAMCEALYGDTHRAGWDFGVREENASPEFKERYRKLARAAIDVTVEACAKMADDYAANMRAAAERPHPVTGRENAIALCKQDAGETIAAALRALALPHAPAGEE